MALFTPTVPASSKYSNLDLNALSSTYASSFGHDTTALIKRIVKAAIFDAAPQQFFDLKLLSMKPFEKVNSDEFFYHEMGYGREPLAVTVGAGPAITQTITLASAGDVSVDTIVVYPNNQKGNVTAVNVAAGTITVTAPTGQTLPQVNAGDSLANLSPVEADGADTISQYFRIDTVERYNYVQMLIKAIRFGKMELFKYQNANHTSNYLTMQRQRMMDQFRADLSNVFWNGERGEVTLASGAKAKTTGGVFPLMQAAGSPNVTTTVANLPAALEEIALDTEFKVWGATRFLYGTPRIIHQLSQQYKRDLTRYEPTDDLAILGLKGVDMGSTKIVFVPMKRLEDSASFPASFANRLFLLDQESIGVNQVFGEEMGETLDRTNGGTRENFKDYWVSTTIGVQFNNPLGSGWIDVI